LSSSVALVAFSLAANAAFIHPGLLLKETDIWRIGAAVDAGTEPWASEYTAFAADEFSNVDWTLQGPTTIVTRDVTAGNNAGDAEFMNDAQAAWQLSLVWVIEHNEAAAQKALEIVEAWGSTLTLVNGSDAQLASSLSGNTMVQAAELLRYTYSAADFSSGWTDSSIATFSSMVLNVLVPPTSQTTPTPEQEFPFEANWGSSGEKALIAFGIFMDNSDVYNLGSSLITTAACANLTGNIAASGQSSESGRDQQHTQLGLGNYAEAFQMLWIQGVDFFALDDNRLMAGLEYTAQYLNGEDVDYDPSFFRCDANLLGGPWSVISPDGRDLARPVFELGYAHYVGLKGLSMPNTAALISAHCPDGQNPINSVTDGAGWGTLLFRLNATIS